MGFSACSLFLGKELIGMFQLLQTGSPHRSLPCRLCCLLLYSITAFAAWSSLHEVPKREKLFVSFHYFPNAAGSHSLMSSTHFYFPVPSNWLCEVFSLLCGKSVFQFPLSQVLLIECFHPLLKEPTA